MDLKRYNLIKAMCAKHLVNAIHDRHLDDCVQYVCLRNLERPEGINILWCIYDYCRDNGIGKRGKAGARALEFSLSLDAPTEESSDSYYLIDNQQEEKEELTSDSILEELFIPLKLNSEVMRWAIKTYKWSLSNSKLNSLMKSSN